MKILMINSVCGIRSTGRICTDLATAISSLGHEVKIAYGRLDVPENYQNYAVRIGNNLNVGIHAGTSLIFDNSGFMSRKATEKLIDWIKNYDPDIIHLHNIHGYYLNIELLFEYLKTSGKKILWTLHDCWAFTGHCAYFDYSGCQKWKTGCFKCPSLKDYPPSLLLDRSQENYLKKSVSFNDVPDMTLITPSEWLAKLVHESFLKKYPVKVINNSINYDVFHPVQSEFKKKFEIESKIMVLGVASIWDRRKGLDDFIKLSSVLPNDFKIVLVGLSKKQIKKLIREIT